MFTVNEYFDGKVKSLGFTMADGPATIGVMAPGEYEFGTSSREIMTVTSGSLTVKLPGSDEWRRFGENESFTVEAGRKFQLKVAADASYLCRYR
ncbi:MAG TPA: pyrimidine/purine nucleoside phosphorylase [Spirochaetota bacterium]|nr:pyrimidine/purine nucleoside phosphorylase [Spirochaetota bacterium]HNT11142.1 pyrimidine/purine nucleoside phosphorylase [Spirochaetota bacterium]HNV48633.1 pyrimidine/purine nucleoside phosphorylase [Spirochaetota bacterium]HOS39751.1 pyrimidine/purine nucleoside phosphorylase [Spirochaetota bacterium]HPI23473.1 pyrimidine/purine nucleoside phosphorylase [Spirochaetota bacterium]